MLKPLIKLITILLTVCLALPVFCTVVDVKEDKSKVRYSLSVLGIPFKVKDLPTSGQIFLEENLTGAEKQCKTFSLKGFYIKTFFTSKRAMFRELVEADKYPYFSFSTDLKDPIPLEDSKVVNVTGYLIFKGIPKKINIDVSCEVKDNYLSLHGDMDIKMTDFGIEPPKILFITIDDLIKTKIDLFI